MKNLILVFLVVLLGCSSAVKPHKSWEDQPRDEKGQWISELTDYARKQNITHEIATAAGVPFEQYVYDYSVSHGPALNKKERADYDAWKAFQNKK
jgi:hypothetical protein